MARRGPSRAALLGILLALGGCDAPGDGGGSVTGDGTAGADAASAADGDAGPGDTAGAPGDAGPEDTGGPPADAAPGDTAAGDTAAADTGDPPEPTIVDPNCLDGQWTEVAADPTADIAAEVAAYTQAGFYDFLYGVFDKRYPLGGYLVASALAEAQGTVGHCLDIFLPASERVSAGKVIGRLSTAVHECGHFLDIARSGFSGGTYVLTETVQLTCSGGAGPKNGGPTFARSRLNDDDYAALYPPCGGGFFDCDTYADIYLDGDPDNATFEGGDQGLDSVMEETVQYVNSLATGYAFADQQGPFSVSERDGILTFLWYVERYLRKLRLDYPAVYAQIAGDACWRQLILQVWGRAWLYLGLTADDPSLGIADDVILDLVLLPELLEEIQRLRDAQGCGG